MRRFVFSVLGLCVLLTAGCRGISYKDTITLDGDLSYHEIEFRGPKSDQTIEVIARADALVNVYLTLADDKTEAIAALRAGKKPRKTLARGEATKEAKLEGKVAAGQSFIVLIQPAEKGKEIEVELDVH